MYNDDDFNEEENESSQSSGNKLLDFYEANKKLVWILVGIIIFILIASLFMGGGNGNSNVTPKEPNLVISSYNEKISINNSTQLYAKVEDDTQAIFNWISSNPEVATVNSNGVVTGVNYGTAIITVTYTRNGTPYSEKCEVVVAEGNPNVQIQSVNFPNGEVMISVGDTFNLPVIVNPSDGYMKEIKYSSYNNDVVTVDANGVVKALKVGKATIKVTINNNFTDEINVHVLDKKIAAQIIINPTNIGFLDNLLKIEVDEKVELEYNYEPSDVSLTDLIWTSSDSTVATVVNGVVTGQKVGKTEIKVEALNGVSSIISIEVVAKTIPVEAVQIISDTNVTLNTGGFSNIIAAVLPGDATNKDLTYKSTNTNVVKVDENGNIMATGIGSAQIIVTSVDGQKTASVYVTVNSSGSSGSSGGSSGGSSSGGSSSSSVGYIKFRDANDKSIADSVSAALENNNTGPVTVNRSSGNVTKLKYCGQKCSNSDDCGNPTCTPSTEISMGGKINFTDGNGIYVIKSIKYNGSQSEDVKLKYVNIGGVTSLGGTTSSSGSKSCWMVGGEYKWTTETEAKKKDEDSYKVTSRDTQAECEGTSVAKTISTSILNKYWNSSKTGYLVQIKVTSSSNMKKLCYCYGSSCNLNISSASSPSTNRGSFITGGYLSYYSLSGTSTYCINTSSTGFTQNFYNGGTGSGTIKFKAIYSDNTESVARSLTISKPN